MGRVSRDITAKPDPGEKILYTGDLREFLNHLLAAGDDGDTIPVVKTTVTGKIKSIRAEPAPEPPSPAEVASAADWQNMARYPADTPPALGPGDADTDMLPAGDPITGTALARPEPAGPRHRK